MKLWHRAVKRVSQVILHVLEKGGSSTTGNIVPQLQMTDSERQDDSLDMYSEMVLELNDRLG